MFRRVFISDSEFPSGRWAHVALTLSGQTGTLYLDGSPAGENKSVFLSPCRLPATNNNWIGRSQYEPIRISTAKWTISGFTGARRQLPRFRNFPR